MNEDDLTKNLPHEAAPTADPLSTPDTAPMLERILAETFKTRDLLMAEIQEVKQQVERLADEMRAYNKRAWNLETDLARVERSVETLEGKRP